MKNERQKKLKLYKIMDSKDQINLSKEAALKSIEFVHIKNKIKDTLKPLNKKIQNYNKKIDSNLKKVLNTSDIIDRAKVESFFLKDILLELDRAHNFNISKFKTLSQKTNNLKNDYIKIKQMEKIEKNNVDKNEKDDNKINITNKNKGSEEIELSREKIHNLLSDNILLMAKKREIFSYYLIKNKYQRFNDERKIRYINKLKEFLELKQIECNDLLDEKEKKAKIENNKFFINQKKRINIEKRENYEKMCEKINKENELSLRSIKETNATLNSIMNNKSFLDEEIKLKYEHNHSQPSLRKNNLIERINKEKKLIKEISGKYSHRINKSHYNEREKRISKINNKRLFSNIKSTRLQKYLQILNQNNKEDIDKIINDNSESIINLKGFRQNSTHYPKFFRKKSLRNVNLNNESVPNDNNLIYEDRKLVKSRILSVYEEIKNDNILPKKDEDFIKNYFVRKKAILSKKPRQAVTIMSNSLSRINEVDITKKIKRIHGQHIPEKYTRYFDNLERLDISSNNMKCKIYDSICKKKMES